jgi:hypothetical protein
MQSVGGKGGSLELPGMLKKLQRSLLLMIHICVTLQCQEFHTLSVLRSFHVY